MSRLISTLLLSLVLVALALPSFAKDRSPSTLDQIQKRGVLRVGFDTFVPWAMKNKEGQYIGFEIDVARRLAQDMEVDVEFVPTKWSGIIPALLTGKFDIIIGGMGILPSRSLKVNFSNPYEYTGMSIVANKALVPNATQLKDFNTAQTTLALKTGATSVAAAKKYMPQASLLMFDDEAQALQEVLNGRAQAMIASAPFPEQQALRHPEKLYLPLKGQTFTKEPIGFAVRKGDWEFLTFLNSWILVADSEGWLEERFDYWFKTVDWENQIK